MNASNTGMNHKMNSCLDEQIAICNKYGSHYLETKISMKVGISSDFDCSKEPINGLRHPLDEDTSGWYIWSGEKFSEDDDFFVPIHAAHLVERCPKIIKYLGLAPGWRFMLADGVEDVWQDPFLLQI